MGECSIDSTRCSSSSPPPTTPPGSSSSRPPPTWGHWGAHGRPPHPKFDGRAGSLGGLMRSLAILGATGSIGTQALDVVRAEPDAYEVVALGASSSVDLLAEQANEFRPKVVAIADATRAAELEAKVPLGTEI